MADSADGISYITHNAPAWRPASSHIAMVDLAPFGFENEQEQVWLRPLGEEGFEVCCIPFRVHGVSLGDRGKLSDGRFVSGVLSRSGRRVFRVFFTDPRPPVDFPDSRDGLRFVILSGGFLAEWSGDRHVAIDIPESCDPSPLFRAIEDAAINETVYCEWGDSEPFALSD
ncbi:DUF4265 domain-containing protein [Streptomyces sp. ISL-96]|uniref:DUF4265 domain-containing protein n=1 Tax=Streptomyces sp. ISL-96 TaxID=2819191 RepID=UPI001BEA5114|nr:DUF4265 domain-containing protein [Streptomyces sp. ISL-96]MBT2487499.1 DUF4265 domain-containing protein [Streptomyces sp. ISL-96]